MHKYQHIVNNFDFREVEGLLDKQIIIQPKLDGSNCQIYIEYGKLVITTRNHVLSAGNDIQDCYKTLSQDKRYFDFFVKYPHVKLVGEWLIQHSIIYQESAYNKLYVFDGIIKDSEKGHGECDYIQYEQLIIMLNEFNIEHVPYMNIEYHPNLFVDFFKNLEYLQLANYLVDVEKTLFYKKDLKKEAKYIDHLKGFGEGIIVKNYNYKNRFNRSIWCKLVNNEHYKNKSSKIKKEKITIDMSKEEDFINNNLNEHLMDKCYFRLDENKNIGDYIKLCQKEFKEDFVIDNSELDIKIINKLIAIQAKEYLQNLIISPKLD